jgi:hypothetical protein
MKDDLFLYTVVSRFLLALAYVGLGVWIVLRIAARSPDLPVAARALNANHRLAAGDLQTEATAALVGKYLETRVDQGKPVAKEMVSRWRVATNLPATLAAVVAVARKAVEQRGLGETSKVRIVFPNTTQELAGVLDDVRCDEQICSLIVGLPAPPPSTINPLDFSKADVLPAEPTRMNGP